jgi:hypothetical protein
LGFLPVGHTNEVVDKFFLVEAMTLANERTDDMQDLVESDDELPDLEIEDFGYPNFGHEPEIEDFL